MRDAGTANVMRKLLDGARDEFFLLIGDGSQTPSNSLVLADALEQHGHPRLARELARFMTSGKRGTIAEVNRIWKQLEKDVSRAIDKVEKGRFESPAKYTPLSHDFYRVSDQEAARLVRERYKRLTYKPGQFIEVILPDGRMAELRRVDFTPLEFKNLPTRRGGRIGRGGWRLQRHWTWAVILKS